MVPHWPLQTQFLHLGKNTLLLIDMMINDTVLVKNFNIEMCLKKMFWKNAYLSHI